jgi:hypothetical protein
MKRTTLQAVARHHPGLKDAHIYQAVRPSPGWCEARYLRTIKSLEERGASSRDYVLLWVFAVIERQWGFALDIACAYQQRFGRDDVSTHLRDSPLKLIYGQYPNLLATVKRFFPRQLKRFVRKLVRE